MSSALTSTAIRRGESGTGAWWLMEREPHPLLRPYVLVYEDYESARTEPQADRHAPFGGMPLIWTFEGRLDQLDARTGAMRSSNDFIAGLHERSATTVSAGRTRGVQVNLTPIGAWMLLGMPMSELANSFITLDEAPAEAWRDLGGRLEASASSEQKFGLLDQFFLRRVASASDFPEGVAWAWNEIQRHAGRVPVASLTAALGVTRKRLVQDFREYVGLPPKTIARIARFNRALRMMEGQSRRPAWTRIAVECGYFDQAHFIREVRALTGDTPTELLRRLMRAGRAS